MVNVFVEMRLQRKTKMKTEYIDLDRKYRIKYKYDMETDQYFLQKRVFLIFWKTVTEAHTLSGIHEAYEIELYLNEEN